MAIFVVVGHTEIPKLGEAVRAAYPEGQHFALPPSTWFVKHDSHSVADVASQIGISDGKLGTHAVVFSLHEWSGWGTNDLWEWIKGGQQGTAAVGRPHYAYLMFNAASLAAKLGHKRISVIEYGVAGGNGLVALEQHAAEMEKQFPVEFEIYGFDTGRGLPRPTDFRDLPYFFEAGTYPMDQQKLAARLQRASLVIGDVRETAKTFFADYDPAPIGALAYDLDFYSSTVEALHMLTAGEQYFLPRVFCYFDDTIGDVTELYNDFTGERLAIHEFNERSQHIKLATPYYLTAKEQKSGRQQWQHQIWIAHFFQHSQYNTFVGVPNERLDLI